MVALVTLTLCFEALLTDAAAAGRTTADSNAPDNPTRASKWRRTNILPIVRGRDAGCAEVHRRYSSRVMSRLVLAGATTAVTNLGVRRRDGNPSHATGRTTCVPVPPLSAAAKVALAADAGQIEQQTNVSADGSLSQTWYDRQAGRSRFVSRGARGKIHSELVTTVNGIVTVDYDARTWLRTSASPTRFAALSGTAPSVLAYRYRSLIASGKAKILGAVTVDGTPT